MRARDDAPSTAVSATPAGVSPVAVIGLVMLLGALPGAAAVGWFAERNAPDRMPRYESLIPWTGPAPTPQELPRPLHPGERLDLIPTARGTRLAVRALTWQDAEALAGALQARHSVPLPAFERRRAEARAAWTSSLPAAPSAPLSPAAECVAQVYARAAVERALAGTTSAAAISTRLGIPTPLAFDDLVQAEAEYDRVALLGSPDELKHALEVAHQAERGWLDAMAVALPASAGDRIVENWRRHDLRRAAELDQLGHLLEDQLPNAEREPAGMAVRERCLAIEATTPDPGPSLLASAAPPLEGSAHPIVRVWLLLFGVGALAGSILVTPFALWVAPRLARTGVDRRPRATADPAAPPARAMVAHEVGLHVVSGPDSARIAAALSALAGHLGARGRRVLIIDGGRRLHLHHSFGGVPRLGLIECLAGELPLLGAVQSAGIPGLYLLAHGHSGRDERWALLGRLLEDARSHFGHVLLALDATTPHSVGDSLAGRVYEAWWAEAGPRLPRTAVAFSERLGMPLNPMGLWMDASLQVEPFREGSRLAEAPPQEPAHQEVEDVPLEPAPAPVVLALPTVLDCDLQVRERLRFLIWMHRVQAESRRENAKPVLTR